MLRTGVCRHDCAFSFTPPRSFFLSTCTSPCTTAGYGRHGVYLIHFIAVTTMTTTTTTTTNPRRRKATARKLFFSPGRTLPLPAAAKRSVKGACEGKESV